MNDSTLTFAPYDSDRWLQYNATRNTFTLFNVATGQVAEMPFRLRLWCAYMRPLLAFVGFLARTKCVPQGTAPH